MNQECQLHVNLPVTQPQDDLINDDLRTILFDIQSSTEKIKSGQLSQDLLREFATNIYSDACQLLDFMDDMHSLERDESGAIQLYPEWLNLNNLIIEVAHELSFHLPAYPIYLQLATALPLFRGDRARLLDVISAIMFNVSQISTDGDEMLINSQVEGQAIHICICQSKMSVDALDLTSLFDQSNCINLHAHTHQANLSPDLLIASEVLRMHGGKLWSECWPDVYTSFHFTVRFAKLC